MDFLNDIGRKFTSMARSVTEKTREGVENTRIFTDLRGARNDLEALYCEYGKVCYGILQGADEQIQADVIAARIAECLERIETLEAQRDEMRAGKRCPACGSNQAKDARFCSGCGARLPEEAPKPEVQPVDAEEEFCPGCGALRENDERFCPVCGKDFEQPEAEEEAEKPVSAQPAAQDDPEEPDEASVME